METVEWTGSQWSFPHFIFFSFFMAYGKKHSSLFIVSLSLLFLETGKLFSCSRKWWGMDQMVALLGSLVKKRPHSSQAVPKGVQHWAEKSIRDTGSQCRFEQRVTKCQFRRYVIFDKWKKWFGVTCWGFSISCDWQWSRTKRTIFPKAQMMVNELRDQYALLIRGLWKHTTLGSVLHLWDRSTTTFFLSRWP